jgi:hypothetical protein
VAAWAVNQLYWAERALFDALLDASARLHAAQSAGDTGASLRDATKARREATAVLLKKAESLLAAAGHGATAALQQRVSNTLLALAGPGGGGPDGRPGRLTRDLGPPGFEALAGLADGAAPKPRKESPATAERHGLHLVPPPASAPVAETSDDRGVARTEARAALALAEKSLERARNEARAASGELTIAHNRAEGARSELAEATRRLERARERVTATSADEAAAEGRSSEAAAARDEAEGAREAALRALRLLE